MLVITTDVFCDDCRTREHGTTGPKVLAWTARAQVYTLGWVHIRRDGQMVDLCPDCAKKAGFGPTEPSQAVHSELKGKQTNDD